MLIQAESTLTQRTAEFLHTEQDFCQERVRLIEQYESLRAQEEKTAGLLRTHQDELEAQRASVADLRKECAAAHSKLSAQLQQSNSAIASSQQAHAMSEQQRTQLTQEIRDLKLNISGLQVKIGQLSQQELDLQQEIGMTRECDLRHKQIRCTSI